MTVPIIAASVPDQGLARDANGRLIDNTGFAEAPIKLRDYDTGGTVDTISTSAINVQGVSRISLWLRFLLGSLTNITITPKFSIVPSGSAYTSVLSLYTAGSRVMDIHGGKYLFDLSVKVLLPIINPGACWMTFVTTISGSNAGSKLGLHYSRSYLTHDLGVGIPNV